MGSRGKNNKSYALWEELNLRVSNEVGKVAIYKKTFNDTRNGKIPLPIEERGYYIHIPVPNTKEGGIRKSIRISDRETAIEIVNELLI